MSIGHFAVAFAAKRAEPSVSLGTYVAAAQLPDSRDLYRRRLRTRAAERTRGRAQRDTHAAAGALGGVGGSTSRMEDDLAR
jgi:hypothetical protein